MTMSDPESHAEALDVRNSSSLLQRATDKSCKIWGPFWVAILLENMANILVNLIYPDMAVASLNNGVDACVAGGEGSPDCQRIISEASGIGAMFSLVGGAFSIVCIPFISSCADHFGRRPMLILAFLSSKVPLVALLCVAYAGASIYYFYAALMVPVLIPGPMLFWLWINDRTKPSERGQMYGRLAAAQNIEGIIVPLAAALAHAKSAVLVLAVIRVSALTTVCFVRESRAPDMLGGSARSAASDGKQAFLERWKNVSRLFAERSMRLLIAVGLMGLFASTGVAAISLLYCKEQFGASMETYAPLVTVSTVSNGLVQLFVLKPLNEKLGLRSVFLLSVICGICMSLCVAMAPSMKWLIVINIFSGFANLGLPAFQAVISNVADTIPGLSSAVALGALQALVQLVSLLGPPVFQGVLSLALRLKFHPESPFILGAACNCLVLILLCFIPREFFSTGI